MRRKNQLTWIGRPAGKVSFLLAVFLFLVLAIVLGSCKVVTPTSDQTSSLTPKTTLTTQSAAVTTGTGSESTGTATQPSHSGVTASPSLPTPDASTSDSGSSTTGATDDPQTSPSATDSPTGTPKPTPSANPTATPRATVTAGPTSPSTTTTATTKTTTTAKPTVQPTASLSPTPRPTATPAATPTSSQTSSFPVKNYGTFFRDNYGQNSQITESSGGGLYIDTGSTPYGVVLVRVDSIPADKRCKAIVMANGKSYQYDITVRGTYVGLPLQMNNGTYTVNIYEQVEGTSYTAKMAHTFNVALASSLKPYTAASIMSDFSRNSACVSKAGSLCSGQTTQTGKVDAVYRWIVANITYDRALASSITSNQISVYLPDPDRTYTTRKGICFDYASLMCAMLRSQGIPTRLIMGSTPLGYHAWNEVFFEGQGWVVVASFSWQQIDGSGWVMFDTTFAAGNMDPEDIQSTTHTKQKTY